MGKVNPELQKLFDSLKNKAQTREAQKATQDSLKTVKTRGEILKQSALNDAMKSFLSGNASPRDSSILSNLGGYTGFKRSKKTTPTKEPLSKVLSNYAQQIAGSMWDVKSDSTGNSFIYDQSGNKVLLSPEQAKQFMDEDRIQSTIKKVATKDLTKKLSQYGYNDKFFNDFERAILSKPENRNYKSVPDGAIMETDEGIQFIKRNGKWEFYAE